MNTALVTGASGFIGRRLIQPGERALVRRFVFLSSVEAMAEPREECVDEEWPGEPATVKV